MKIRIRFLLLLAASLVLVTSSTLPQSNSTDAKLSGSIADPAGAAISGAHITAESAESSNTGKVFAVSSADGTYSLTLPAGRYRVYVSQESFITRELIVELAPGESRIANLRLALQPLSSSVAVTAQVIPLPEQQTTAPVDIITREEIEQRQAVFVPDLLYTSPGVAIGRTGPFGGTASLFLNGGNSNFTKVLVDGTPINPPGAPVDFSSLTTDNLEKVEIVRGTESAVYGSDAVSGVVQFFSRQGETRIPEVSAFAEGGSFASGRGGAQISGLLAKFDYSGAASYFSTDGQGPNDEFLNRAFSGNFGYSFSENNQIRLTLRDNTSGAGIPGATLFGPPDLTQGYGQKIFSANLRWDFATGAHWHHEIMGTESYTRQHSFDYDPTFGYDDVLKYNRAGVNAQSTYVTKNFAATLGYQYEVENGEVSYISPGHLRRNNQGGYIDLRYSPISRLSLDLGVRAEDNASFGTRVSPRAGGTYLLHASKGFLGDTRYRAFYGQGIKEPRFDQSFGTDPCFPGNPNLKPEASKGWGTGFEQNLASDRVKLSADYFYTRFYDVVSFAYNPPPNPDFCGTYFNTDLAIARGVNLAGEAHPLKWLRVIGNYTYDDTRVLRSENPFFDPSQIPGNHLLRRPVNSGSLILNVFYARINWNFIGYFSGVRTDSNFVNPTQINNPGYARFDMAASYNVARGFALTARCTNLLDKQYQDALGYPALGRDYRFGVRYTFAGRN
jgi:outer membrane cobalamin receptor